jgi:hypothetical protein
MSEAEKVAKAVQVMLEPRRAEQEHRRYLDASRRADAYRKERDMWKAAAEAEALIGKELLARAEKAEAALKRTR